MIKLTINKNIIQYTFSPVNNKLYSNNVFTITSGDDEILIDTGLKDETELVLKDIGDKNVSLIVSHFHMDYMGGLPLLSKAGTYGSDSYNQTMDLWYGNLDKDQYKPKVCISDSISLNLDTVSISIKKWPGHSACTVITSIDDEYLHVADELMYSVDGRLLVPGLDGINYIDRNLTSLEKLKLLNFKYVLFGHGEIKEFSEFKSDLEDYLRYYKNIYSRRKVTIDEALKGCRKQFAHKEWHENLYS